MKRIYIYICLLVALCIVGCRPRGVLSSREMREVLHDLHRADAILQVAGYNYGNDEALSKYYQQVLDKHGITQAQFDSSLVWYTDHPQRFDKIYPRVVAALEAENKQWLAEHDINTQSAKNSRSWEEIYQHRIDSVRAGKYVEETLWKTMFGLRIRYLLGEDRDFPTDSIALPGPLGMEKQEKDTLQESAVKNEPNLAEFKKK